jgi:APA family basic amino acid/polyamine antiporter
VDDHNQNQSLNRELGLYSATLVVIANMVGTGIFTTSGLVARELGHPSAMLACWLVGGVFALCGAFCYGELGSMFPRAGGEYVFIRESLGRITAFLSGWISLIVGFSAPLAASAIAFAVYFLDLFPGISTLAWKPRLFGLQVLNLSPSSFLAAAVIALLSLAHYHSLVLGTRVQNLLTLLKIAIILAFIGGGCLFGSGGLDHFGPGLWPDDPVFTGGFAVALIFVTFAYSGWNGAAYLGGEIVAPGKNIPRALISGTSIVICLYLLLNAVYIYALAPGEMAEAIDVGAAAAAALFGESMGRLFAGAIALALLSVISAMVVTGPRVYYAMARDGLFFESFGRVASRQGTPVASIFFQALIAIVMVFTSTFDQLLIYIGFTLAVFASLAVFGLIRLRLARPDLPKGYKTPGYPATPILFIAGNLWIIYYSIQDKPVASLFGALTILAGLAAFFGFDRKSKTRPS